MSSEIVADNSMLAQALAAAGKDQKQCEGYGRMAVFGAQDHEEW